MTSSIGEFLGGADNGAPGTDANFLVLPNAAGLLQQ